MESIDESAVLRARRLRTGRPIRAPRYAARAIATALPAIGALCLALWAAPCAALDGVALAIGQGDVANLAEVSLQWRWDRRWFEAGQWQLTGYWDLSLGRWQPRGGDDSSDVYDLGATPMFRFQKSDGRGLYFDGGVGAHLLSRAQISNRRHMSSAFQFGPRIAVGARFGAHGQYDLQYRFQHLSNAGIKEPNPGINFNEIRFTWWFR